MTSNIVTDKMIKISFPGWGTKIFWNDYEITSGAGLSVAVNTLGLWTNSFNANWQILGKKVNGFKFNVVFKDLPLRQAWDIVIEEGRIIRWRVDVEIEDKLYIDEFRFSCLPNSLYKIWWDSHKNGFFSSVSGNWQNVYLGEMQSRFVGVSPVPAADFLPVIVFSLDKDEFNDDLLPCVQDSPVNLKSRLIGFRRINLKEKIVYPVGKYHLFSGTINLFREEEDIPNKKWNIPYPDYKNEVVIRKYGRENWGGCFEIALVNLPWQENGRWGVRAGSRWPHLKDVNENGYMSFPFFLAYAAALLEKNDIKTVIIDAIANKIDERSFVADMLSRDIDYLIAETSAPSLRNDLILLEKIAKFGISIILCGPCASIYDPEFLKEHSFIDFVLYGEYEYTLLDLALALRDDRKFSDIPGLICRDGIKVIKNPPRAPFDINLLPWPHRDSLSMERYIDMPGDIPYPSVQMLASRGCPFRCSFCLWPQVMYQGCGYRPRDIHDVVAEMGFLVRERKFKSVYFDDDTFNVDRKRVLKFCDLLKEEDLRRVPWAIMARADLMDEEMLIKMKESGLSGVKYGIESFNNALLKGCSKNLELEKTIQMIRLTKDLGIGVHLTFTLGLDGETRETALRTIDYALALKPDSLQFSLLTPFPGTRLFEELDAQKRILTKDWSLYDGNHNCVFKPAGISPEELVSLKQSAYVLWEKRNRRKRWVAGIFKRLLD